MEDGATLDKAKVEAALKDKKLGLKSVTQEQVLIPKASYMLVASGIGWADTNDKVRAALEKHEGITGAYIDDNIILHYTDAKAFDEKEISSMLLNYKIKVKSSEVLKGEPFS